MNPPGSRYWFPTKRYGYGWGPPATWQGWTVMIVWLLAMAASSLLIIISFPLFFVAVGLLAAGLLAICYAKGEPARWRWGENSTLTCPGCKKSFPASAKFCPHCGHEEIREIAEG